MTTDHQTTINKKPDELTFLGGDPGAVKHGNFINYYTFHSAKDRIINLDKKMFPDFQNETLLCLDIGCNSGELTKEFYFYLKEQYPKCNLKLLAVDIDEALIERANESNNIIDISFVSLDIMTEPGQEHLKIYLDTHGRQFFDITFCFSVTMWIHLNNGDEGLLRFLQYVKDISKTVVLETQPWNCYRNAQRRMKKQGSCFPHYKKIKIRSDVNLIIEKLISESTHRKVYESPNSSWNRKIQSFEIIKK